MVHATHRPPGKPGSAAPPPAGTTAAGLPARMPPSRTVNTDPRDGPHRKATTPDDARASRAERASRAARPSPGPGTIRPPRAWKVATAPGRAAPTGPGRNTTDRAQPGRPVATTASSAY